ncbi:hypothetical protein [Bacillus manliponensis]|uniref:hypothetical protein n=1 Tax=Bacillus manliponensis TaxID=574376 RepID=UPI00068AE5AC|nr:hypothetical protein [Bacillus manliponensis]
MNNNKQQNHGKQASGASIQSVQQQNANFGTEFSTENAAHQAAQAAKKSQASANAQNAQGSQNAQE